MTVIRSRRRPSTMSFRREGIKVILTPFRAPKANAYAERFVRTARAECLDWLLILGPRQLDRVLRVFVEHYNRERPHRALGRCPPGSPPPAIAAAPGWEGQAQGSARRISPRVLPGRGVMERGFGTLQAVATLSIRNRISRRDVVECCEQL